MRSPARRQRSASIFDDERLCDQASRKLGRRSPDTEDIVGEALMIGRVAHLGAAGASNLSRSMGCLTPSTDRSRFVVNPTAAAGLKRLALHLYLSPALHPSILALHLSVQPVAGAELWRQRDRQPAADRRFARERTYYRALGRIVESRR